MSSFIWLFWLAFYGSCILTVSEGRKWILVDSPSSEVESSSKNKGLFGIDERSPFRVSTCMDRIKNQDETDIDCGGTTCSKRCDINQGCNVNSDCMSGNCDETLNTCQAPASSDENNSQDDSAPSCSDGNKNQDESDIDCGGTKCSKRCDINQGCNVNSDCMNGNCHRTLKTCQVPCSVDGNKNQDETDIDCGGSKCSKRCDINQGCNVDSDCTNGNCYSTLKTCQDTDVSQSHGSPCKRETYELEAASTCPVSSYTCNDNPKNLGGGYCILTLVEGLKQCNSDPDCGGFGFTTNVPWHNEFDHEGLPAIQLFKKGDQTTANAEWNTYSKVDSN